jgi:hypothetical protein
LGGHPRGLVVREGVEEYSRFEIHCESLPDHSHENEP